MGFLVSTKTGSQELKKDGYQLCCQRDTAAVERRRVPMQVTATCAIQMPDDARGISELGRLIRRFGPSLIRRLLREDGVIVRLDTGHVRGAGGV